MSVLSHEEKMLNLQHQMRQNQSELQSYLAGLNDWESEIREKERKLKASQSDQVFDGQDRRAETSSSEYETDEEWELERKKHLAELEKDKGNKFLKDGDFERAVEAYSKGMEFDTTNSILPANRALALIKQHKFAAAELDCTCSLALAPLYVKAYLRRAVARAGLGNTQDALHDYQRVLELEPTNKHARAELDRLEKDLSREEEEDPVRSSFSEGQSGLVKPVYKSLGERSKVMSGKPQKGTPCRHF
ncbi:hypothetical protein EGW08_014244 [Elysia chlorotica]|uniref:Uncharacterized protein n=1 Tax=Elysia chlorotica TaxID=188477 RepID=A0A3S1BD70_ELYCH|nr:hypothetical protein EGW08_014244 [Elysia chlorotica]